MKIILPIIAFIFATSCLSNSNIDPDTFAIQIDVHHKLTDNQLIDSYELSNFISKVEYVKLETTANNLISYITKVHIVDDRIFILNFTMSYSEVLMFNGEGHFIDKVSARGRGRSEYLALNSLMFDDERKRLMIYCGVSKKIIYFDYDGVFEKSVNVEDAGIIREMTNLQDGGFLCYTHDVLSKDLGAPTGLWKIDSLGRYVKNYIEVKAEVEDYKFCYTMQSSRFGRLKNGDITITDGYDCDLYRLDVINDKLVDYVDYNVIGAKESQYTHTNDERYTWVLSSQTKGKYIYTKWTQPSMTSIYNTSTDKIVFIEKDFNYDLAVVPNWLVVDNNLPNAFIVAADGSDVADFINNGTILQSNIAAISKVYSDAMQDSNPLLQILYIKE